MSLKLRKPYYPAPWLRLPRDILDVAILGGGQSGLAIAYGLRRAGIDNLRIFDQAALGGQGVWQSVARMRSLRTDKNITGPELGNPLLSYRYWHETTQGAESFAALERIPRLHWQAYLDWFAAETRAQTLFEHRLQKVDLGHPLRLTFQTPAGPRVVLARHLVLATGMDGFGAPYIPSALRALVAPEHLRHSQEMLSPAQDFTGKRLVVLGGSASAFDVAATALEAGAREVVQVTRNPQLALQEPLGDLRDLVAATRHFHLWPEADRWAHVLQKRARGTAPPQSIARAKAWGNYSLREGEGLAKLAPRAGGISYEGRAFDGVIAATGYRQGAHLREEFRPLAGLIRQWGDLHLPHSPAEAHWGALPYLGAGFELLPKSPEHAAVSRLHVFTFAAILSHGFHVGDIASAQETVPRLVAHLSEALFRESRGLGLAAEGKFPLSPPLQREEA